MTWKSKGEFSSRSFISQKWTLFLCLGSFCAGMLFTNRIWSIPEQNGLARPTASETGKLNVVSDGCNSRILQEMEMRRETRDMYGEDFKGHNSAQALDKTISNLEMDLAAARAVQESVRSGAPVSEDIRTTESSGKRKYLMVVGINTAFSSRKRRDSVRATWLPQGDKRKKLEEEKGIVIRFVIGHSATSGGILDRAIEAEDRKHGDFLRLNHVEGYLELSAKTKTYFATAVSLWDADFYVKVDDDVHVNIATLGETLVRHRSKPRIYIGCMKSGPVLAQKGVRYHEPEHWKFGESGNKYFRHATGQLYAISNDLATYISMNQANSMASPYGGRGRGRGGRGRGRGVNLNPSQETNIPLIGDWTTIAYKNKQSPKKEEASSSNSQNKLITYKDTAISDPDQIIEYLENPVTEKIMFIEHDDIRQANNNAWSIRTRYLDSRGYPGLYGKARPNLEILLNVTESVTITHYYQGNNPESFINFSKCHINKVLLPREWGFNPNGEKAIKIAEGKYIYFNYWDYVQAFTQTFYYQNPKNKHSWFFSINPNILDTELPNWFFEWWMKFGPSLEILPKEINDLYKPWCDTSNLISKIASNRLITGQCPAIFFIKFQIPWIWRWSLSISKDRFNIPILTRNFFYKWWNKMSSEDIQNIVKNINKEIKEDESNKTRIQDSSQFSLDQIKSYFQRKYPNESEEDIMIRTLDHMKTQFFRTFPMRREDAMSTSSQGSMDILAGESQPPTPEDFWEGLIEGMVQEKKSREGK